MKDIIDKLNILISELNKSLSEDVINRDIIYNAKSKIKLYIKKALNIDKEEYLKLLENINDKPITLSDFYDSANKLLSVSTTIVEDIDILELDLAKTTEASRQLLNKSQEEIKIQKELLKNEKLELDKFWNEFKRQSERLLHEEKKLDGFKKKLEFADKGLDFNTNSIRNRRKANLWGGAVILLVIILLTVVYHNINDYKSFTEIAKQINSDLTINKTILSNNLIENTIYFSYYKYIASKVLLYSILIYITTFCVKNFNSQMHNYVVNTHKANSLSSTLSILNIAKSENGNDQLLVQATQAIFSHQNSGFNNHDIDVSTPSFVTNMIDSVSRKI